MHLYLFDVSMSTVASVQSTTDAGLESTASSSVRTPQTGIRENSSTAAAATATASYLPDRLPSAQHCLGR